MENNENQENEQPEGKVEKVSFDEIKTSKVDDLVDGIMEKILQIK